MAHAAASFAHRHERGTDGVGDIGDARQGAVLVGRDEADQLQASLDCQFTIPLMQRSQVLTLILAVRLMQQAASSVADPVDDEGRRPVEAETVGSDMHAFDHGRRRQAARCAHQDEFGIQRLGHQAVHARRMHHAGIRHHAFNHQDVRTLGRLLAQRDDHFHEILVAAVAEHLVGFNAGDRFGRAQVRSGGDQRARAVRRTVGRLRDRLDEGHPATGPLEGMHQTQADRGQAYTAAGGSDEDRGHGGLRWGWRLEAGGWRLEAGCRQEYL